MNAVELLRFKWTPSELRLLLAAWADAGPVSEGDWAVRAGLPRNHLLPTLERCVALGGIAREARAEGIVLFVQPVEFWKVTPRCEARAFNRAWRSCEQVRLAIVTEQASLAEAMRMSNVQCPMSNAPESGRQGAAPITGIRSDNRNPVLPAVAHRPESGCTEIEDRDRSVLIEKEGSFSRVSRDREGSRKGVSGPPSPVSSLPGEDAGAVGQSFNGGREWLLAKLKRIPRLEAEVLRPQGQQQERIARLFWELEGSDPDWLRSTIGDLADDTAIGNKAAWFNIAATRRVAIQKGKVGV